MNNSTICPRCQSSELKPYRLPNPLMVFWVLMPPIAFNELILGQRMPRFTLVCRSCPLPPADRHYIPCPSCGTLNVWKIWSRQYRFGNWLGLVCPQCGKHIPCLWNLTSLLLLLVLMPVWYLPYRFEFKNRVPKRPVVSAEELASPLEVPSRLRLGLSFCLFALLVASLLPYFWMDASLEAWSLFAGVLGLLVGGAVVGFCEHGLLTRRGHKPRIKPKG